MLQFSTHGAENKNEAERQVNKSRDFVHLHLNPVSFDMLSPTYTSGSTVQNMTGDDADGFDEMFEEDEIPVVTGGIIENQHRRAAAKTTTTDETAESILANELNNLSFHERETINEEIHGVNISTNIKETPETLTKAFRDLQTELEKLCETDGSVDGTAFAFKRSQDIFGSTPGKGTVLNSKEIRVAFLRCERFDCKKAAARLCRFANLMYELYGDVALERKVKLTDMSEEELAIMRLGHCQNMRDRDRAGRRVYMHIYSEVWDYVPIKSRLRIVSFYMMSLILNDVGVQSTGIVFLFWMHNFKIKVDQFIPRAFVQSRLTESLPMRMAASHIFFPSSDASEGKGSFAMGKIFSRVAKNIKPRIRMHWGM